jgi:hypothetical protein
MALTSDTTFPLAICRDIHLKGRRLQIPTKPRFGITLVTDLISSMVDIEGAHPASERIERALNYRFQRFSISARDI